MLLSVYDAVFHWHVVVFVVVVLGGWGGCFVLLLIKAPFLVLQFSPLTFAVYIEQNNFNATFS